MFESYRSEANFLSNRLFEVEYWLRRFLSVPLHQRPLLTMKILPLHPPQLRSLSAPCARLSDKLLLTLPQLLLRLPPISLSSKRVPRACDPLHSSSLSNPPSSNLTLGFR